MALRHRFPVRNLLTARRRRRRRRRSDRRRRNSLARKSP